MGCLPLLFYAISLGKRHLEGSGVVSLAVYRPTDLCLATPVSQCLQVTHLGTQSRGRTLRGVLATQDLPSSQTSNCHRQGRLWHRDPGRDQSISHLRVLRHHDPRRGSLLHITKGQGRVWTPVSYLSAGPLFSCHDVGLLDGGSDDPAEVTTPGTGKTGPLHCC